MEGGRIVQADLFAEVGQSDALTMARYRFQDRKGTAERLDADPLLVVGFVVGVGLRRLHQPRDG
jgi:hypothetical protein